MRADDQSLVEAIAAEIRHHLETHPQAADSADGVARWWLGPASVGMTLSQVEHALNLLVARHAMRRVELTDGTFLFSQVPAIRQ